MRGQLRPTKGRRQTLRPGGTASMSRIEAFEFGFDGRTPGMPFMRTRMSGRKRVGE